MKAQMFIITMIFLIGLIFAVLGNLAQYNTLDLADVFKGNDLHLLSSIKSSIIQTIITSPNCNEAGKNIQELDTFLEDKIVRGTAMDIDYSLNCSPITLTATIYLKSIDSDTRETFIV